MKACSKLILTKSIPEKANLQCLYNIPNKVRDEVDVFDADKHPSLLTVDFNTLSIKVF